MAAFKDELARESIRNADRLVLLSDGVYAIALTILVLDIKLPASFDTFIFWLNLLLLLSVAFIPFPISVLALGINKVSVVFYASCLTIAEGLEAAQLN